MEEALLEQSDLVRHRSMRGREEVDYVANDPYLKKFVQSDEDGTPRNVLSAARAKGSNSLELHFTVVEQRRSNSPSENDAFASEYEVSIDKRLGLEYFMIISMWPPAVPSGVYL